MIFLQAFFLFFVGLAFGSFANVLVDRGQKKKSILGSSKCDFCGYRLRWFDNVPVLSFLFLGGQCRKCKKRLSWQYPAVELGMGLLFLFVGWQKGFFASFLSAHDVVEISFLLFLSFLLFVIFLWDVKYMIIPDGLVLGGVIVALAFATFTFLSSSCNFFSLDCEPVSGLLGGLIVGGFFYLLFVFSKGKWIGGGDVKLGFLLGLLVGWNQAYFLLLFAYVLGALVAVPMVLFGKKGMKSKIPFGPFLVTSSLIVLLFGEKMVELYRVIVYSL